MGRSGGFVDASAAVIWNSDRVPIVSYGYDTPAFLPYNSQRQVITVATLVAHLVFVAVVPLDDHHFGGPACSQSITMGLTISQ